MGSANVAPIVDFSTTVNTVDPATFGIPGDIQTTNDRPALQSTINFLLGRVGNISQGFVQHGDVYAPGGTVFNFAANYPGVRFYAQDTWSPRPNLTIDAGLRWEAKLAPSNPDNLIRRPNQSLAVGQPPSSTLRWETGKLYKDDWNNVAPSIGVAWDPKSDESSVIRGNYRMAFDRINTFLASSCDLPEHSRHHRVDHEHGVRAGRRPAAPGTAEPCPDHEAGGLRAAAEQHE